LIRRAALFCAVPVMAITAIVGFTWTRPSSAASASTRPGVVAIEGPMSGTQAATGIDIARGAQLAADQINAAGGVDGVKLSLLRLDDAATAKGGLRAAKRAVASGSFGVVGPFNSSVGIVNLPLYKRAGLPVVRLTSSVKTEGDGVTTQPMDSQVAPVEIQEITHVLDAKRPAIIYDTSTYTAGIASQVKAGLKKAGDPAVGSVSVTGTQTGYGSALQQLVADHPDLLYIAAYGAEAGKIALAASTMNLGTCFVDLAAQGTDFVSAATDAVAEHCLASGVPSAQQFTGATQYVADYEATYHAEPGTWGTFSYDSVEILANAVTRAGGWNRKAVARALAHTTDYQGITGPITIAPVTGNRVQSMVVILDIDGSGNYVIDPTWAAAAKFPAPASVTDLACADVAQAAATISSGQMVNAADGQQLIADAGVSPDAQLRAKALQFSSAIHILDQAGVAAAVEAMTTTCRALGAS
jgi:branched-chain amino acid transport system substrate-binding protein